MRSNIPTIDVKKYGGKQVAIVNGRIIASGRTLSGVIASAKRRMSRRQLSDIRIFAVPKTLSAIYYVV